MWILVNFISLCARYVHGKPICIGYVTFTSMGPFQTCIGVEILGCHVLLQATLFVSTLCSDQWCLVAVLFKPWSFRFCPAITQERWERGTGNMCHKNMERRGYIAQLLPFDVGNMFPIFLERCQETMY
jgi:hypothetical protein